MCREGEGETNMIKVKNVHTFNFDAVPIKPYWNFSNESELKIHQIHAYPAKFPAFVTTKAINYAKENTLQNSDYQFFFLCAFSNILKGSSRWSTKSIKLQVDPNKKPIDVYTLLENQYI